MRRTEPPPLAAWMLEHCIPGEMDEALAGDLEEDFHAGRSDAWYWRQALAACLAGWLKYLSQRRSLLVFALLWSMLSPAWIVLIDRAESNSRLYGRMWEMDWPFSALSEFILWILLSVVFLWAGMLLFVVAHRRFASVFSKAKLKRAFAIAPLIYLPAYFATFVLMNIFAWPGLRFDRRMVTPLGEIADVRLWADVLRIPFFIALVWALWGAAPRLRATASGAGLWTPPRSGTNRDALARAARMDGYTVGRFLAFMVGTGLLNALIAGILLCRLPDAHAPSLASLLVRGAVYVAIGALAGVAGAFIYWNNPSSPFRADSPLPFPLFALVCAAGWVWVPAVLLLLGQVSAAAAFVAMVGAFSLAAGRRYASCVFFAPAPASPPASEQKPPELFAETLYRAPREASGYLIALCLYGAGCAIACRSNYTAAALLAVAGFLLAWNRIQPRSDAYEVAREFRRAGFRLARVIVPAILVTLWALMTGVAHRNRMAEGNAALAASETKASGDRENPNSPAPARGFGGYQSVILWPVPEKKQIVAPIPPDDSLLAPGSARPLVIRFDGEYWYLQPPDKRPGPYAPQARGTPVTAHIESNNSLALMMEAHQHLGSAIRLAQCREIDVEVENRENKPGTIALAVFLKDETQAPGSTMYVGQQTLVTTEPGHFTVKSAPAFETLRFAIPEQARIRKFDEITVMVLPDIEHEFVGPRIAIRQFQLFAR